MASGKACKCVVKDKKQWEVLHYKHNHSAFESPKYGEHSSQYSTVRCKVCGMVWHTKALYVEQLPLCADYR